MLKPLVFTLVDKHYWPHNGCIIDSIMVTVPGGTVIVIMYKKIRKIFMNVIDDTLYTNTLYTV